MLESWCRNSTFEFSVGESMSEVNCRNVGVSVTELKKNSAHSSVYFVKIKCLFTEEIITISFELIVQVNKHTKKLFYEPFQFHFALTPVGKFQSTPHYSPQYSEP